MNKQSKKGNEIVEIDLKRLWKVFLRKLWIICLASVAAAAVTLLWTVYMITPLYQSSAMFYVNNSDISMGDTSLSITSSDITASKNLVNTYAVILNSRTCLNDVIDYAGLEYDYEELKEMISASAVNETEVFQVVVTNPDPQEAKTIANAIAYILPNRISEIVEGTSAKIVDYAVSASTPSSPNYAQNTFLGFLAGFILSLGIIVLRAIYDVTIRTEEDVEQCSELPILAAVPDMLAPTKGKVYASRNVGSHSKKKKNVSASDDRKSQMGSDISFAAAEAYKLLRTKLQFSFVDEIKCPVIGVSSAMSGEGKSLSSINLAYSLAQLKKRVLLIDCDMRRPSINAKLLISQTPGLSEYLIGHCELETVVQFCKIDEEEGFYTITAGRNPPNPIELLSSSKMSKAIKRMREDYDYIILDLPPVGEVSDAMVAAKVVDGILLVVRQDYCTTVALNAAVKQFEFIETRILGIVMNCVDEHDAKYGYGKKYYSKYRYSHSASPSASDTHTDGGR